MPAVYIGPYLRVPHQPTARKVTSYVCSPGCGRSLRAGMRFCPDCGSAVQSLSAVEMQRVVVNCNDERLDDNGRWFDTFWTPESSVSESHSLWLPNKKGFGFYADQKTSADDPAFNITDAWMQVEKEKLLAAYASPFKRYEQVFGQELEVLTGVVIY